MIGIIAFATAENRPAQLPFVKICSSESIYKLGNTSVTNKKLCEMWALSINLLVTN